MSNEETDQIKEKVKGILSKLHLRKQLSEQLATLNEELKEYDEILIPSNAPQVVNPPKRKATTNDILSLMSKEEVGAGTIAEKLGVGKQTIVKKLDELASAKQVIRRKDGNKQTSPVYYKIAK